MTGRQQTIILKGIQASSWLIDPLIRSKIKRKKTEKHIHLCKGGFLLFISGIQQKAFYNDKIN